MKYIQIDSKEDKDIPYLLSIHRRPEVSRFISINEENYFNYVTTAKNVFYFKVYSDEHLVGAIHCEIIDQILYMSIIVVPEYQKQGIGAAILYDIQNKVLPLTFTNIMVSIERSNTASLRLFNKMGFTKTSEDVDLIEFVYSI